MAKLGSEDAPFDISTLGGLASYIIAVADAALAIDGMREDERKKHYPHVPHGKLKEGERQLLVDCRNELERAIANVPRPADVPTSCHVVGPTIPLILNQHVTGGDVRAIFENVIRKAISNAFKIGQLATYNPIVMRLDTEKRRERTKSAREKHEFTRRIVIAVLQEYRAKKPNSKSRGQTLIDEIRPSINEALKAIGRKPIDDSAVRKQLDAIRKTAQPSND